MENKKRKVKDETSGDDDDELNLEEEMKMDKFYSLLRSFREARDRRRKELEELDQKMIRSSESNNKKSKITETNIWVPSFESGDFTTEVEFRKPPLIFPSPSPSSTSATTPPTTPCDNHKGTKDHHHDDALDLNLSL